MLRNFVKRVYRLPEDAPSTSAARETTTQDRGDMDGVAAEVPVQTLNSIDAIEILIFLLSFIFKRISILLSFLFGLIGLSCYLKFRLNFVFPCNFFLPLIIGSFSIMSSPGYQSLYDIRILSWNLQRIRSNLKQDHLNYLIKTHNIDILLLVETKAKISFMEQIFYKLHAKDSLLIPSVGKSGCIAIVWFSNISASLFKFQDNVFHFQVLKTNARFNTSFIYGALDNHLRIRNCDFIYAFNDPTIPWAVIGDMNFILNASEKEGGNSVTSSSYAYVYSCIQKIGLIDLNYAGLPFTWTNKRSGTDHIQERLDRVFVNHKWLEFFPNSLNSHLTRVVSDHAPIMLQTTHFGEKLYKPIAIYEMLATP